MQKTTKKEDKKKSPTIACPTCQTLAAWSTENPSRPFCSERCKLIDLGEWASESYAIEQKDSEEDEVFSSMMGTHIE